MNTPTPPTPFTWQGRVDAEDSGDTTRWHQRMQPFTPDTHGGVTLLGFAVDEGVRRNGGRPGAAQGPHAIRQLLANLPVLGEPALHDGGDVHAPATTEPPADPAFDPLAHAQAALAQRVAQVLRQGSLPVVLGGGHEVAWGSFQGLVQAHPEWQRVLVLNLDAHFDLREAAQANSGTPFRQVHDWCAAQGRPFVYRVLGISRFGNTQALFDRAERMGVRHWLDEALQTPADAHAALHALQADLDGADAVYLTVCLDVLPGGQAPGVSAPSALGVPLAVVERLIDGVLRSGKVALCDVAELNPTLDRDQLTARVAARLVARMARGLQVAGPG
jgi:formiminoglutamase